MFCCTLLYVHSSIAIILMGKIELVALLNLSSCCLVMDEWLFLAVPWGCLRFVIVVFPDHSHLLFSIVLIHFLCNSTHLSKCSVLFLVILLVKMAKYGYSKKNSAHVQKAINIFNRNFILVHLRYYCKT